MKDIKTRWLKGLRGEPEFWRRYLQRTDAADLKPRQLRSYFGPMLAGRKKVTIADIGSGPVVMIGYSWPGVDVKIYPMDILAVIYAELLQNMGLEPIVPVQLLQNMERLNFPDSIFDIVHCSNALDHCVNPKNAIREFICVCKPGGWVYLRHFTNVGKRANYAGLPQWNIHPTTSGDCLFWDATRKQNFLLSEIEPGFQSELKIDTIAGDVIPQTRNKKSLSRMGVSIYQKPL